jgi:hypothetical protein
VSSLKHIFFIIISVAVVISHAKSPLTGVLPNIRNEILKGNVYVDTKMESTKKEKNSIEVAFQTLNFSIYGLHPQNCQLSLRKLSRYEKYQNYLNFVKKSDYNDVTQKPTFLLTGPLLPFSMILSFKLPRITKPGIYSFSFDEGFLSGLTGTIDISEENIANKERCLFYTHAQWSGPATSIPNIMFEFFVNTIAKMSMEKLFHISSY